MKILLVLLLLSSNLYAQKTFDTLVSKSVYVIHDMKNRSSEELRDLLKSENASPQETLVSVVDSVFVIVKKEAYAEFPITVNYRIKSQKFFDAGMYYILDDKNYESAEYIIGSGVNWFILNHKSNFTILYELQHNSY